MVYGVCMGGKRQLLTVRQLRDGAREVFDAAAEGAVFEVGAHRKAEVVITGMDHFERLAPPESVMVKLLAHLAVSTADLYHHESGDPDRVFHPGDAFGAVLAWLWRTGQETRAVQLVVDLTAELREHNPHAGPPRLAFSRIVSGIGFSLPNDFTGRQREDLTARLNADVPGWFSESIEVP